MKPREGGRNLVLYFLVTIVSVFIYISLGVYLIIRVILYLK